MVLANESDSSRSDALGAPLAVRDVVRLTDALAELEDAVPDEDRALADRVLAVPAITARDAPLTAALGGDGDVWQYVVVDGVVLKETALLDLPALEVLTPGDLVAPALTDDDEALRGTIAYRAHGPATLAPLDGRFRQAARRWPGLSDAVHRMLARQTHRASVRLAVMQLPRVEDRVAAVFADLAERLGHVTPDGLRLDLPLTHLLIGQLVGSRRPTISLALRELGEAGLVVRDGDRWHVAPRLLDGERLR